MSIPIVNCIIFTFIFHGLAIANPENVIKPIGSPIPGTQGIERKIVGIQIDNQRNKESKIKITVNDKDTIIIVLDSKKSFCIYSILDEPTVSNAISYYHNYSGGSDEGRAMYAYLTLDDGIQKPMSWSENPYNYPEKERTSLYDKDIRYNKLTKVKIESIE